MHPAFRRHSIHIPSPISYSTITKIIRTENTSTSTRPIYITIQTQSKLSNHHPTSSDHHLTTITHPSITILQPTATYNGPVLRLALRQGQALLSVSSHCLHQFRQAVGHHDLSGKTMAVVTHVEIFRLNSRVDISGERYGDVRWIKSTLAWSSARLRTSPKLLIPICSIHPHETHVSSVPYHQMPVEKFFWPKWMLFRTGLL